MRRTVLYKTTARSISQTGNVYDNGNGTYVHTSSVISIAGLAARRHRDWRVRNEQISEVVVNRRHPVAPPLSSSPISTLDDEASIYSCSALIELHVQDFDVIFAPARPMKRRRIVDTNESFNRF